MASEHGLWITLRTACGKFGHWERIENLVNKGTPDVNWAIPEVGEGWLELKHAHAWPKRLTTPLVLDHFTNEQRIWLRRRRNAGGNAKLLLQVEEEYLLFHGDVAAKLIGTALAPALRDAALVRMVGRLDPVALIRGLRA